MYHILPNKRVRFLTIMTFYIFRFLCTVSKEYNLLNSMAFYQCFILLFTVSNQIISLNSMAFY